jgi:hypothetical protein
MVLYTNAFGRIIIRIKNATEVTHVDCTCTADIFLSVSVINVEKSNKKTYF